MEWKRALQDNSRKIREKSQLEEGEATRQHASGFLCNYNH